MDILFSDKRFGKLCGKSRDLQRKYGAEQAKKIVMRLQQLQAAHDLGDLRDGPGRLHELHGDRARQFSLDLKHPYRLIFEAAHDPPPTKPDGGLDWRRITRVKILGVVDTHD